MNNTSLHALKSGIKKGLYVIGLVLIVFCVLHTLIFAWHHFLIQKYQQVARAVSQRGTDVDMGRDFGVFYQSAIQKKYWTPSYDLIRNLDGLEGAIKRVTHQHETHITRLMDSIQQDTNALASIIEKSASIYFPERSEVVRVLGEIEAARSSSQPDDATILTALVDISHDQLQVAGELYENAQKRILYTDILSLKHQIQFYAEVYRSRQSSDVFSDIKEIQKKFKQTFSRINLTELPPSELQLYYDEIKTAIANHDKEITLLRQNAQEKRKILRETEAQKWTDTVSPPPTGPVAHVYKQILVVLAEQTAYAYEDGDLIFSTPITSGRTRHETVRGTFRIYNKERDKLMKSPFPEEDYELWVDYWMPFFEAYGIHDSCNSRDCWRTKFGPNQNYKGNGSHGCINTPYKAIKFLYNWADIGTTVVVR